ncbi:fasciclin domain-containing protein [Svornostia abyssi]|uniref:Fasciclin domain-containing protein n=1 Tax=Svornostia abyssi TaxID=2898438 RepID=A0ABY5PG34_9ACTN|nr:fasciclin domain-containing protein [Parviterribacteraceae bacterium J379]
MRSSRLAVFAALPVLALGVAACGDDEDESASTTAAPAETQTTEMAASEDIVALASGNDDLSTLVTAVTAADLVETLQGDGPFTVFAPTNEAFEALPAGTLDDLLKPENKEQLTEILTYHVVPDEAMAADLTDGQKLKTVQGEELEVGVADDGTVTINGAEVTTADVDASNGVVHVIDEVLTPPSS